MVCVIPWRVAAQRSKPSRLLAVTVGLLLSATLVGCQGKKDVIAVGVYNDRGVVIEADTNSTSPLKSYAWTALKDGERRAVKQGLKSTTKYLYGFARPRVRR